MTGAPKVRAMELIDQHEVSRRGWYSGSVGYFSPDGDFDFNVIIRSLQYNAATRYLSLTVGGAITAKANAEREFEECLLKAKAIFNVLNHDQHVS
jgi:para-aminobenzoate synthetase component 1